MFEYVLCPCFFLRPSVLQKAQQSDPLTFLVAWLAHNLLIALPASHIIKLCFDFFFFYLDFFSQPFTNHGTVGEGEGISLTPYYHFHPLHRHLDIRRAITAESSPLHIGSSRSRTGDLWFPSETFGLHLQKYSPLKGNTSTKRNDFH